MAGKAVSLDQHPLPGACQGLHPRCLACFAGRAEVGGAFLDDSPAKLRHAGGRSAFAWGKGANMAIDTVALFDQAETVLEHPIALGGQARDNLRPPRRLGDRRLGTVDTSDCVFAAWTSLSLLEGSGRT